jgi:hypothetical protein
MKILYFFYSMMKKIQQCGAKFFLGQSQRGARALPKSDENGPRRSGESAGVSGSSFKGGRDERRVDIAMIGFGLGDENNVFLYSMMRRIQ